MGWKSTKIITREEALTAIYSRLEDATNDELSLVLESLGYGENSDLKWYGNNFTIEDDDN